MVRFTYEGGSMILILNSDAAAAEEFVRTWYVRHVALDSGRSSTWTTGLGAARMVAAVVRGSDELWPASIVLRGG